jgi:hypothetical protein
MSRLYVLTHEIIELEDYEKVPGEGTEIMIALEPDGEMTAKRADSFHPDYPVVGANQAFERIQELREGLRDIVSMYAGFTNTKEMMERARKALGSDVPNQSDRKAE